MYHRCVGVQPLSQSPARGQLSGTWPRAPGVAAARSHDAARTYMLHRKVFTGARSPTGTGNKDLLHGVWTLTMSSRVYRRQLVSVLDTCSAINSSLLYGLPGQTSLWLPSVCVCGVVCGLCCRVGKPCIQQSCLPAAALTSNCCCVDSSGVDGVFQEQVTVVVK